VTRRLRAHNASFSARELLGADRAAVDPRLNKSDRPWYSGIGNPVLHSIYLIRGITSTNSHILRTIYTRLLIAFHGSDVHPDASIGPGFTLVHPVGLVLGEVTIGSNVQIYNHVTVGRNRGGAPTIDDDVTIFPHSMIIGPVVIGRGATIGSGAFVDFDVEPNTTVLGSRPPTPPIDGAASRSLW
jgi:serine O-acetyltransferase